VWVNIEKTKILKKIAKVQVFLCRYTN